MKIPLYYHNKIVKHATIDDEDFDKVKDYRWCYHGRYATAYKNGKHINMHRIINNTPDHLITDHANGDGLDNRKQNLRSCTYAQNCQNRRKFWSKTGYRCVYWYAPKKTWQAQITVNKKTITLGFRHSKKEAAELYNKAAQKYFGEFACLNKI